MSCPTRKRVVYTIFRYPEGVPVFGITHIRGTKGKRKKGTKNQKISSGWAGVAVFNFTFSRIAHKKIVQKGRRGSENSFLYSMCARVCGRVQI